MKVPENIGTPISMEIWHDNSGGKQAGWFLGKIAVVDRQENTW